MSPKPDDTLRVAVVQMHSTPDPDENRVRVEQKIAAVAGAADLVVFPECVFCLGSGGTIRRNARPAEVWRSVLAPLAAAADATVAFGGVPVLGENGSVTNRCIVVAPDGHIAAAYDKVHLFRLQTGNGNGPDESRIYTPGTAPAAFDLHGWRIALSICYDLRFPELYRALAPFDLLLCPAAFTMQTGRAHWLILLQARAVENLAYAVGANQWGKNQETGIELYGNSAVVGPWGEVLAKAPDTGDVVLVCELRKSDIGRVRSRLPALDHRRFRCF